MRRDRLRTADPSASAQRDIVSRLGVDTQRDVRTRDRDNNVGTPDRYPVLVCTTLGFFREDLPAATVSGSRLIVPTAAATFGSVSNLGYLTAREGRVVRAYIVSNAARTNGSLSVRLRIGDAAGVTDYDFTDCVLDGGTDPITGVARTQVASQSLNWSDGIPYAAGNSIFARFVADASWAPVTADVAAYFVLAEQEWIDA